MSFLRHWFGDNRRVYKAPDGSERPERRKTWQVIGPGQLVLYALVVGMICAGLVYVKHVQDQFQRQAARTVCLRGTLRPIVAAAARLSDDKELLRAERAYLDATKGLRVPKRCP